MSTRGQEASVHTELVIGGRDVEAGAVSARLHGKGNVGAKEKAEVIAEILGRLKSGALDRNNPITE